MNDRDATNTTLPRRIAIVGRFGGSNVGGSLTRASESLGIATERVDLATAERGNRMLRALSWRFHDRRPLRMARFAAEVLALCAQRRPEIVLTTGAAPLDASALRRLQGLRACCINYSTDDPWNPTSRARWHLEALSYYDIVFTPRRSNIADLQRLGCRDVRYLPFAYDPFLVGAPAHLTVDPPEVLFVGGADADRIEFIRQFMRSGPKPVLVGAYWDRHPAMRPHALGLRLPQEIAALTAAARVNLCLVRRSNRDGHVMRTFEIAAAGGCMLVEDTQEHRAIFGADGDAVLYFKTPEEAAQRAQVLASDRGLSRRLASCAKALICSGRHSYADRLEEMMSSGVAVRSR